MVRITRMPLGCMAAFFAVCFVASIYDLIVSKNSRSLEFFFGLLIFTIILNVIIFVIKSLFNGFKRAPSEGLIIQAAPVAPEITAPRTGKKVRENNSDAIVLGGVFVILLFGAAIFICSALSGSLWLTSTTQVDPLLVVPTLKPIAIKTTDNTVVITPSPSPTPSYSINKVTVDPSSFTCEVYIGIYSKDSSNTVEGIITNKNDRVVTKAMIRIDVYEYNSAIYVYSFNIQNDNIPANTQKRIRQAYLIPAGTSALKDGKYSCKPTVISID